MDEKQLHEIYATIVDKYHLPPNLKDAQVHSILNIINKVRTFTILPTGYGKTLCFIVPPLILNEVRLMTFKQVVINIFQQ